MDILHSTSKLVRHAIFSVASLPHLCENLLVQEIHDCEKRVQARPKAYYVSPDLYNTLWIGDHVSKFRQRRYRIQNLHSVIHSFISNLH
jgi:hypothetical protein